MFESIPNTTVLSRLFRSAKPPSPLPQMPDSLLNRPSVSSGLERLTSGIGSRTPHISAIFAHQSSVAVAWLSPLHPNTTLSLGGSHHPHLGLPACPLGQASRASRAARRLMLLSYCSLMLLCRSRTFCSFRMWSFGRRTLFPPSFI